MFRKLRQLFSRRRPTQTAPPSPPESSLQLNYSRLEPRIVLNASFTFAGGLLTMNNFTQVGTESLTISENGGGSQYLFTLTEGVWSGTNGGGVSGNGSATLSANKATVDGIAISDTAAIDFGINVIGSTDFSGLTLDQNGDSITGDLLISGVGAITQNAGTAVTVNELVASATSVTWNQSGNNFGTLLINANDANIHDTNAVALGNISVTNNFTLSAGGAVSDITGASISSSAGFVSITSTGSITLSDTGTDSISVLSGNASFTGSSISVGSAGTANFLSLTFNSAGTVDIHEASSMSITGTNTAGSLLLSASSGAITDDAAADISVTGNASFTANGAGGSITLGDVGANDDLFGSVTFNSIGAVSISENDSILISGTNTANSLSLIAETGSITDDATADIAVTNNASFTANGAGGLITLGDLAANDDLFGSLTFNSIGAVSISENDAMVISGTNLVDTLVLIAESGSITDNATADITVTNNASFAANGAGGSITLGDQAANDDLFGSITFNSIGAVNISENDALVISGTNTADALALIAEAGSITDDAAADITVTNNASFTANGAGGSITIGDQAGNDDAFGSVTFNSVGSVFIREDNAMTISGTNTAGTLTTDTLRLITESGAISDDATADITTTGNASFTANGAGGAITIGDQAGNDDFFFSVTFNTVGAVNINENDAMVISGTNTAASGALTAEAGSLTDDATADITVTGELRFVANGVGGSITIGDQAANDDSFGSVRFNSVGAVNISENDAMVLSGTSTAASAVLTAETGSITDDATADVTVTGNISFVALGAGGSITIGDQAGNDDFFGSVTFNSVGAVNISENNALVISGTNTAPSLLLTAESGSITDDATADVTVTGNASFLANGAGGAVTIGDQAANDDLFGSLTFNSIGAVNISENDDLVISGTNTAGSAVLTAETGTLTDDATADVTVTGNASFVANGAGGSITIGDQAGNDDFFGSVTFSSIGAVNISENDALVISGTSTAPSLLLTAESGSITDDATADVTVTGNVSFVANGAGGSITIGDQAANDDFFGSVTFNSIGAVNISENDALVISGTNTAASAALTAETSTLTDDATADITVTGNVSFTANGLGGSITIGDQVANDDQFGSVTFNSVGAVAITEDDSTVVSGTNTADSLILTSGGSITDAASPVSITVTNGASFDAAGNITLADGATDTLAIAGAASFVTNGLGGISLGMAAAFSPFDCALNQSEPDSGATVNFGTLFFDTADGGDTVRGDVSIKEDSSTAIVATSRAKSLYLGSGGTLGDTQLANIDLSDPTLGAINLYLDAAGAVAVAAVGGVNLSIDGLAVFRSRTSTVDVGVDTGTGLDSGQTVNLARLSFRSPDRVRVLVDSSVELDCVSTADRLELTAAAGTITDSADSDLTVTNNARFTANGVGGSITLGDSGTNDDLFGTLTFSSVGAVNISENDSMVLSGTSNSASAALTAETGTITDDATADLTVTGNASFTANGVGGGVTIGDAAANDDLFGSVTFNSSGAVNISENDSMVLSGSSTAASSALTAEVGTITDDATADMAITGNASFTANGVGGSVTIGDAGANDDTFGSVTFNSVGAVNISANNALVISGTNSADSLQLTAESGTITDDATADVTVTSNAAFTANGAGGSITIGDQAANDDLFGSVTFNSIGAVSISENDAMVISGTNTAASALLAAESGSVTDDATADVTVTGNASFVANGAGGSITIGDQAANDDFFGSITFNSVGAVSISENDAMVLSGSSSAPSAALTAETGSITDNATADVTITGNIAFTANGAGGAITIGDQAGNDDLFGSVTFNSVGAVSISENDAMVMSGTNTAASADLVAETGTLTDDATADVTVTGNASFTANGAGGAISIGSAAANDDFFGSITFNSVGAVNISENDALVISGNNSAASVVLNAESGSLTDDATADITVGGNASFTANGVGGSITLGDQAANDDLFGTVTFNSIGAVSISENDAMILSGVNSAASAALTAESGTITDDATADITVTGNASFTANGAGGGITIGDQAANDDAFGSITFNSIGAVSISENDTVVLSGANTALSAFVASELGSITDDATADITVTANASFATFTSGQDIIIGDNVANDVNFGSLTFAAPGTVSIVEDSSTVFEGASNANNLFIQSAGTITDLAGATLTVQFDGSLNAASDVLLTDAASNSLIVNGNLSLNGTNITLAAPGTVDLGSITFNSTGNVIINSDDATTLRSANTAGTLNIVSAFSVIDLPLTTLAVTANMSIVAANGISFAGAGSNVVTVGGNASLTASNILFDNPGTVNFGTLTFNSTSFATIFEDSSMNLVGSNTSFLPTLTAAGSITDAAGTSLNFNAASNFSALGSIILADQASNVFTTFGQATFLTNGLGSVQIGMNPAFSPFAAGFELGTPDSGATVNFGSIRFDTSNLGDTVRQEVRITEDSSTTLVATSRASSLYLGTQGSVNDTLLAALSVFDPAGGTSNLFFDALTSIAIAETTGLSINGVGIFRSATSTIDVGVNLGTGADSGQTVNLGTLTFISPNRVRIAQDNTVTLDFNSTAQSLSLAGANIFNSSTATLNVADDVTLTAVGNIRLGDSSAVTPPGIVLGHVVDVDASGKLQVSATNATIFVDSSVNLGDSNVTGTLHLNTTSVAGSDIVQTSGQVKATRAIFEADGTVQLFNADIDNFAARANGSRAPISGFTPNAVVPPASIPTSVGVLVENTGTMTIASITDPLTGSVVTGVATVNGNIYLETIAGGDLNISNPVRAGVASNTILAIAGGNLNLTSAMSRGPANEGLVTQVAPAILVQNPLEFTKVNFLDLTQFVRFSYGQIGEQQFTVSVLWADQAAAMLPPDQYNITTDPGIQVAHPIGNSTFTVEKLTPYTQPFLLAHPTLTSTLTVTNDAQILTFATGGTTNLNIAKVDFNAFISESVPVVVPPIPAPVFFGVVVTPPVRDVEIVSTDVEVREFDDVRAALGQQEQLQNIYSLWVDAPNAPQAKHDWPLEKTLNQIEREIRSSPNDKFLPGKYQIIGQKEDQVEVLREFEKLPGDPDRNWDEGGPTSLENGDDARLDPNQGVEKTDNDISVWTREWEKWMATGQFPTDSDGKPMPDQLDHGPDDSPVPMVVIASSDSPLPTVERVESDSTPAPAATSEGMEVPTRFSQANGLLVGGALAVSAIHRRITQSRSKTESVAVAKESKSLDPAPTNPHDKKSRRRWRLFG